MIALALAALLAAMPVQEGSTQAPPQTAPQETSQGAPVDLGNIDVVGRPLVSMIDTFVNEVAAPNRHRGIARWDKAVCIGVANLRPETAQYILDRVSMIAEDIGLRAGAPGCTANVIIIATDDADGLADSLVRDHRRGLRLGGSGMDRGGAALHAFAASDRPVRWWQVSLPVDAATGDRAVRLPGECKSSCGSSAGASPEDFAPVTSVFAASRLSTQIVDNLIRTVVILDIDQVSRVSGQQLADYVAMVTLAQIDPEADTSRYASILNIFEDTEAAPGLTNWDQAYLNGLYNAERTRANLRSGRSEIAASIHRAHHRLADEEN